MGIFLYLVVPFIYARFVRHIQCEFAFKDESLTPAFHRNPYKLLSLPYDNFQHLSRRNNELLSRKMLYITDNQICIFRFAFLHYNFVKYFILDIE